MLLSIMLIQLHCFLFCHKVLFPNYLLDLKTDLVESLLALEIFLFIVYIIHVHGTKKS